MAPAALVHFPEEANSALRSINEAGSTAQNFATLHELGGIQALAELLRTDLRKGISKEEVEAGFADRRRIYPDRPAHPHDEPSPQDPPLAHAAHPPQRRAAARVPLTRW